MSDQSDIALQERNVFECYAFYYNCGSDTNIYCLTTSDEAVILDIDGTEVTFSPANVSRSRIVRGSGETADQITIQAAIDTVLMQQLIEQRINQGLSMKMYSVYAQEKQSVYNSTEFFVEFWGESVSSSRSDNTFSIDFTGWNGKIKDMQIPKILFSRTAQQPLYRLCTFKLGIDAFTFMGEITHISDDRFQIVVEIASDMTLVENAFSAGICRFSTVPTLVSINDDTVDGSNPSLRNITLMDKCPLGIVAGETVYLAYGCDNTFAGENGYTKFMNWENYDGFPYIPVRDPSIDILG